MSQVEEEFAKLGEERAKLHVNALFFMSLVWAVGSTGATLSSRQHFDAFVRIVVAGKLQEYTSPSGER